MSRTTQIKDSCRKPFCISIVLGDMNEIIDRPLKELFAAIYHDQEKHPGLEIRPDQEKVLNELLNQPLDFKNEVYLKNDGLEIITQTEKIQYVHSKAVESRVILK